MTVDRALLAPAALAGLLLVYAAAGPRGVLASGRPDLPMPTGERDANDSLRARLDRTAWERACAAAGLPPLGSFDGLEHGPVARLVEWSRGWTRDGDADALGRMAEQCYALGRHEEALDLAVAAEALGTDAARWSYIAGIVCQRLGLHEAALEALGRAAAMDPEYGVTHARIATAHLDLERLDEADAAFARAAALTPSPALGHQGRARVAQQRGDAGSTLAHIERSLALAPLDFQSHRIRAVALASLGRTEEALAAQRRAAELPVYTGWSSFDPRVTGLLARSGTAESLEMQLGVALQSGDLNAAARFGEELLRAMPRSAQALVTLASVHANRADLGRARELAARAIEVAPDNVEVLRLCAEVAIASNDVPMMDAAVERLKALDDRSAPAWALAGRSEFVQGRPAEAARSVERALELAPRDPKLVLLLAEMLELSGRREEACDALRAGLARLPGDASLQQRLGALMQGPR